MPKRTVDWMLEYVSAGECYTKGGADKALIKDYLKMFDGSRIFYCCLSDTVDPGESCICCIGEPDRRVIEGRLINDEKETLHFVLKKKAPVVGEAVAIRCGMQSTELIKVEPCEVLTEAEATSAFLAFFKNKKIPSEFEAVPKSYFLR